MAKPRLEPGISSALLEHGGTGEGSIGRMEGANHSRQGQQMNDAGNQYLGAGVEIRAVVAAMASPAAQEAQAGLGGVRQRQQCEDPPLPHTLPTPLHLPSSPPLLPFISLWLGSGRMGQEMPHLAKTGDLGDGTLGHSVLEERSPALTCLWTPEPD